MIKITRIKKENIEPVYDITVPDTKAFFANDILVHNCSEIFLSTSSDRTAVCCLSSLNLETYDEWKNTTVVQDMIKMLDNVLSYFIENAPGPLFRAKFSALRERSLGLGVMGFHSYLQKNSIAFESSAAIKANKEIFKNIQTNAYISTREIGNAFGEAPDLITDLTISLQDGSTIKISSSDMIVANNGETRAFNVKIGDVVDNQKVMDVQGKHPLSGHRNSHTMALAPTANSSILMGTSPSIEPISANAYLHQTRAGSFPVKNKHLEQLMIEKGINTQEMWQDITTNKGSISHLDNFSEHEKKVFKTAIELDQHWVVQHAADRQEYIDQGQSINLFFPPRVDKQYFNSVHVMAWRKKLKALYYTRTAAMNRAESISKKVVRVKLEEAESEAGCVSCEG